jgi:hypothetical protein
LRQPHPGLFHLFQRQPKGSRCRLAQHGQQNVQLHYRPKRFQRVRVRSRQKPLYLANQAVQKFVQLSPFPRHRLVLSNLSQVNPLTDLVPPPEDPESQLLWARQVLLEWNQDPQKYQGVLGWELILASARAILKQHEQASSPLNPPPYRPSRRPGRPRRPPPSRRR